MANPLNLSSDQQTPKFFFHGDAYSFLSLLVLLLWGSNHAPGPDFWEDTQFYYLSAGMGNTTQGALTDGSCFVSGPVLVRAKDSLSLHLQDSNL